MRARSFGKSFLASGIIGPGGENVVMPPYGVRDEAWMPVVAGRLAGHPVLDGRPAAGARAMARHERLGLRQVGVVEPRALIRAVEQREHLTLDFNGWHGALQSPIYNQSAICNLQSAI